MSAANRGFVVDETVKDQEPSAESIEPQFAIQGKDWKIGLKSLNDPENGQNDERPNLWAKPETNWARLEFHGFKIHHMNEKNWARNSDVIHAGMVIMRTLMKKKSNLYNLTKAGSFPTTQEATSSRPLNQHMERKRLSRIRFSLA